VKGRGALQELVATARQRKTRQPVVVLASDDWGQSAIPDRATFDRAVQTHGIGDHPFDTQGLESPTDIDDLTEVLVRHRDSRCRPAVLSAFFIMANVDPHPSLEAGMPVHRSIEDGWSGADHADLLWKSYREAIGHGVMAPAFHGYLHCNAGQLHRAFIEGGRRGEVVRQLWEMGIPYLPSLTPWAAFAYENAWSLESPTGEPIEVQRASIDPGVELFRKLFGEGRSTCAPGYRSYTATVEILRASGFESFQSGPTPGSLGPIPLAARGWSVPRNVSFEVAIQPSDHPDAVFSRIDRLVAEGFPAVLSIHSINFQSGIRDHKTGTLRALDRLLTRLERRFRTLVYASADELADLLAVSRPWKNVPWGAVAARAASLSGLPGGHSR
jgi:hypothetical protein